MVTLLSLHSCAVWLTKNFLKYTFVVFPFPSFETCLVLPCQNHLFLVYPLSSRIQDG